MTLPRVMASVTLMSAGIHSGRKGGAEEEMEKPKNNVNKYLHSKKGIESVSVDLNIIFCVNPRYSHTM